MILGRCVGWLPTARLRHGKLSAHGSRPASILPQGAMHNIRMARLYAHVFFRSHIVVWQLCPSKFSVLLICVTHAADYTSPIDQNPCWRTLVHCESSEQCCPGAATGLGEWLLLEFDAPCSRCIGTDQHRLYQLLI